jgi:hypothetical protein
MEFVAYLVRREEVPGYLSRYSDGLLAGRPKNWSSIPVMGQETFLFYTASRPALGPTQAPIHWVPGALSQDFGAERPL